MEEASIAISRFELQTQEHVSNHNEQQLHHQSRGAREEHGRSTGGAQAHNGSWVFWDPNHQIWFHINNKNLGSSDHLIFILCSGFYLKPSERFMVYIYIYIYIYLYRRFCVTMATGSHL